ncbi:MAG: tyrosine--tRNA ligase [Patescibacteria group bacterium]|nr:tyrosine--tRNA ligase [Patescibacteria group bacterium]
MESRIGIKKDKVLVREALTRSLNEVCPSSKVLEKELLSGRQLSFYIGIDPTSQHLHLGHAVGLWTLRRFQDLGHKVIFLIGDFTARIGDPTDKMAARQPLSPEEVRENLKTFKEQASRILSFKGKNPARIRCNSEWFEKMTAKDFINNLLGAFNVQNLLVRRDFTERIAQGKSIELREFIYPLLQGWDSRELNVDVEIGGNDQIFNMSIGRGFRHQDRKSKKLESFYAAVKLLVDSSTGKKLSKTEASLVNLDDEPDNMFGRVMALPDGMITNVAELSTGMSLGEVKKLSEFDNPRDAKLILASEIVKTYCSEKDAERAREKWEKLFSQKDLSGELEILLVPPNTLSSNTTPTLLVEISGVTKSKSEARRLVVQGGFKINEKKVVNPQETIGDIKDGDVVQIGKRHFFRVKIAK